MAAPKADDVDRRIREAHDRFKAAITTRLPALAAEDKERYLLLVSTLVAKLEQKDKPLRQVMQESVGELLPIVMQVLAAS